MNTQTAQTAVYIRVSTLEQARSKEGSLKSQRQRCLERAGKDCDCLVYCDQASAKDTNRPEYQRLLLDIKSGLINRVICTELSRISRSSADFHKFLDLCKANNVGF